MDFRFPPKPAPKHLELQKSKPEAQEPDSAPPIAHAGGYMDFAEMRKARSMSQSVPVELPSPENTGSGKLPAGDKGVHLPWDKKHGRSQSAIASGLATTLKFGAAAIPAEGLTQFQDSEGSRKSVEK